ncbi:GPN-loop GTPase, partial [Tremellales sp. Uapishka_1]
MPHGPVGRDGGRENDWYIPYTPPHTNTHFPETAPDFSATQGGIGQTPAPIRHARHNLLSFFSSDDRPPLKRTMARQFENPAGDLNKSYEFPRLAPNRPPLRARSSSYNALDTPPSELPSSNSVNTGLAAPKMLFSPLTRELKSLRQVGSTPDLRVAQSRQRTVSTPHSAPPMPSHQPRKDRQWAAPTMCDKYVFPKPHIVPITITPPGSPEKTLPHPVVIEGQERERERNEWANLVKKRGRSLSLGGTAAPPLSAPVVGSMRARSKERDGHSRKNSETSGVRGGSFSSLWGSRRGSEARRSGSVSRDTKVESPVYKNLASFGIGTGSLRRPSNARTSGDLDREDPFHHRRPSTKRGHHGHSQSNPDLLSMRNANQTLQFTEPSPLDSGRVVVIGPAPDTRRRQTSVNLSKPLPNLPSDAQLPILTPSKPLSSEIGVALSPAPGRTVFPVFTPPSAITVTPPQTDNSPARARSVLAKQHQRALTKKAFQTPVLSPKNPAQQNHVRALSTSSGMSSPRRMTAMEEAIGRSRGASVGQSDITPTRSRPRADTMTTIPTPASPPLVYPITTNPPRQNPNFLIARRPELLQNDSNISQVSVYTDASEGYGRGDRVAQLAAENSVVESPAGTPSPQLSVDDKDFKGLFFRTPRDQSSPLLAHRFDTTGVTFPRPKETHSPIGLGYAFVRADVPRHSSGDQSDSTVEIKTPVIHSPSGRDALPDLLGCGDLTDSPTRFLASFATLRPPSLNSSSSVGDSPLMASDHDHIPLQPAPQSDDGLSVASVAVCPLTARPTLVHFSEVNSSRPITVATPNLNSDIRRRSFVPEHGEDTPPPSPSALGLNSNLCPKLDRLTPNPSPITNTARHSAAVSFLHDFPNPPTPPTTRMSAMSIDEATQARLQSHASAFGQLVTGPPGAGKSTYCHGMHQFLSALGRPVHIINLDPAVPNPPYPCSISITELITLDSVMDEYGLGPNGAMLYCIEYLEANFDWLVERLDELLENEGGNGYVIFDTPGQVELWTNHDSLKRIVERLTKMDYRLAAVHLSDAHYVTDASKFISVVLLALRAMLQLEMPHVNVLSKMDLLSTYGELPFNLDYYTEVQDLSYLLETLNAEPRAAKFGKLNKAMCELVEEFGLVGFETLAVEDKTSMMKLLRLLDKVTGYIFIPTEGEEDGQATTNPNAHALFSSASGMTMGLGDISDVQERWLDNKDAFDAYEKEGWKKEGEMRARLADEREQHSLKRK